MDRRGRKDPSAPQERYNGLSYVEFTQLATYNAERGRGIMHTPEWEAAMAALQARFDQGERERHAQLTCPVTRQ